MSVEASTVESQFNRNPNLPVRIDQVSPETRLIIALLSLDQIAETAAEQKSVREQNRQTIREAVVYMPPFAHEVATAIENTEGLFLEKDVSSLKPGSEESIEDKVDEELRPYGEPPAADTASTATDIARQLTGIFHPDHEDPVIKGIIRSKQDRNTVIEQALRAKKKKDPKLAETLYLETMPEYYKAQVREMLQRGITLEQIAESSPSLIAGIEQLRYLALKRFPKKYAYREFQNPEDAKRKAEKMKWKDNLNARAIGVNIVFGSLNRISAYCTANSPAAVVDQVKGLVDRLEHARGYVAAADDFLQKNGLPITYWEFNREQDTIKALPPVLYKLAVAILDGPPEAVATAIQDLETKISTLRRAAEAFCAYLIRSRSDSGISRGTQSGKLNEINDNFFLRDFKNNNNKNL